MACKTAMKPAKSGKFKGPPSKPKMTPSGAKPGKK
jgi:hypothetical protein